MTQETSRSEAPRLEAFESESSSPDRVIGHYLALGDSFTAGADEASQGKAGGGWADELAATLANVNPALEYRNFGAVGARSEDVAEQVERSIGLEPDLVTLICGGNDVLLSVRPDIESYATNLAAMFSRLCAQLPDAIVITTTTPDLAQFLPLRPRSRERVARGMRELNQMTRRVAEHHGVLCLEFAEHPLAAERESFAGDGYHASQDSNRRAAAAFTSVLRDRFGVRVS